MLILPPVDNNVMMKTILIGVVCLLVGLVVGRFSISEDLSNGEDLRVDETPSRAQVISGVFPRERIGSTHRGEGGAVTGDSGLTELPQDENLVTVPTSLISQLSLATGTRSAGQDLFSRDGKIEQILQITDQEKSVVQKAWRQSRHKVYELEAKASKSENLEDGSVKISVPDLANEMGALGEGFQSAVKNTLGGNRGEVFLAMKQVDQIFTPQAGERTYQVAVESIGDGRWRYRMTLEGAAGRRVWVSEKVPDEIRHLTDAARIVPTMNPASDDDEEDEE